MPLYEYECPKCGTFEKIQKFSDPILAKCPTCGSAVTKLLAAPAIQFKGAGWYVTDYAGKGKAKEPTGSEAKKGDGGASGGESKTEAKPESKTEAKADSKAAKAPAPKGDAS